MEIAFLLKKLLTKLVLPPFSVLLVAILGLLILRRWPRVGRALIWTSVATLLILSTPAVAGLLIRSLDVVSKFDPVAARGAGAIVILGGGLRNGTPEFGDTPSSYTLDRVRYGAAVAKATGLPILVSGGAVIGRTPEGEAMANVLENEFSVPVRWKELKSLDTEDNLQFSAALLRSEGIRKVVLVTHDFHMLRALKQCEAAALSCVGAPVSLSGRPTGDSSWVYALPDSGALATSTLAIHEILGYLIASIKSQS